MSIFRYTKCPYNIKWTPGNAWVGQCGVYKSFVKFLTLGYGIRAGIKLLYRYVFDYNLIDIDKLICRYCPDGNEKNYIQYVTKQVGMHDLRTKEGFFLLNVAICRFETQYLLKRSDFDRTCQMLKLEFIDTPPYGVFPVVNGCSKECVFQGRYQECVSYAVKNLKCGSYIITYC